MDHPVSLYAATKKSNELMPHAYSKLFNSKVFRRALEVCKVLSMQMPSLYEYIVFLVVFLLLDYFWM